MDDKTLLHLNHRGIIPGPEEDETAFLARLAAINAQPAPPKEIWASPRATVHALFDISPDWIPTFYSNRNLPFWQGAATWVDKTLPHIQLKKSFAKGHYLHYSRDEILAHEAAHACRMAFDEPRFEECFAYATSSTSLRRFFGPLFSTSKQSYLFLFSLLISLAAQLVGFFICAHPLTKLFMLLPLPLFFFLLSRLLLSQYALSRCLKNIRPFVKTSPLAAAYRMTDHEIALFARASPEAIRTYISKAHTLRWKLLTLHYFKS